MSSLSLAAALVASLVAGPDDITDWGATLREDAAVLHDALRTGHPGMVNPDDPGFAARDAAAYATLLERAETADSYADYYTAIQHYLATFDDGHLSFGATGATPDQRLRWPGFIVRDDGDRGLIVARAQPWSNVPVGASLVECDGMNAYELGNARQGARFGRWHLASQRARRAGVIMLDSGDPYVPTPTTCTFEDRGTRLVRTLDWREESSDLVSRQNIFAPRDAADFGMTTLADGTRWIRLPSFDGNPDSDAGKALTRIVTEIHRDAAAMRAAPAIVFDLRGNGGGSSHWSQQMALPIWGMGTYYKNPPPPTTVIWRASEGNLASLREDLADRSKGGNIDPQMRGWYEHNIAGIEAAMAAGSETFSDGPGEDDGEAIDIDSLDAWTTEGPVYLLTDGTCMSACLDAVDLFRRAGAIVIGRETGADTIYMEVRGVRVPSGLGMMAMPMKYYVGRERGHNESVKPVHRYDGDMSDTEALQAWVASLPR